jgi:hypothetical protein
MGYAKMGFALSIKTAADQNHEPALRALTLRKTDDAHRCLAFWQDQGIDLANSLVNYTQIGLDFQFIGKISIDNKSRFNYQNGSCGHLIVSSERRRIHV